MTDQPRVLGAVRRRTWPTPWADPAGGHCDRCGRCAATGRRSASHELAKRRPLLVARPRGRLGPGEDDAHAVGGEPTLDAAREVEGELCLDEASMTGGAGVVAAVPGVEDDGAPAQAVAAAPDAAHARAARWPSRPLTERRRPRRRASSPGRPSRRRQGPPPPGSARRAASVRGRGSRRPCRGVKPSSARRACRCARRRRPRGGDSGRYRSTRSPSVQRAPSSTAYVDRPTIAVDEQAAPLLEGLDRLLDALVELDAVAWRRRWRPIRRQVTGEDEPLADVGNGGSGSPRRSTTTAGAGHLAPSSEGRGTGALCVRPMGWRRRRSVRTPTGRGHRDGATPMVSDAVRR